MAGLMYAFSFFLSYGKSVIRCGSCDSNFSSSVPKGISLCQNLQLNLFLVRSSWSLQVCPFWCMTLLFIVLPQQRLCQRTGLGHLGLVYAYPKAFKALS